MRRHHVIFLILALGAGACRKAETSGEPGAAGSEEALRAKAVELAHRVLILDTHIDVPDRLHDQWEDISQRTASGDFDYPRAKDGGLDAAFMSVYVPSSLQGGGAKDYADGLIGMVERFTQQWPEKYALAASVQEVRKNFESGLISLAMGMENGAPVEGKLDNLDHFYDRGIRYITLTHGKVNHISDSSYDPERKWGGLSPFGHQVVAKMNQLGIMVDVSHVSDYAFNQVIEITQAPPIASHSSCRHFTPGWERNMSDDMIRKLAEKGGVIQIAWGSSFIKEEYRQASQKMQDEVQAYFTEHHLRPDEPEAVAYLQNYRRDNPLPYATVADVVDHIDHVRQLVGIDYVGFGSDFDGVGNSLPIGLKDVSQYPNLIYEMLQRGYTQEEIEKVCSGNLLRVWSEVEQAARALSTALNSGEGAQ